LVVILIIVANGGGVYVMIAGAAGVVIYLTIIVIKKNEEDQIKEEKRREKLREEMAKAIAEAEKRSQEEKDALRKQMQQNASDFRQKATIAIRQCESNISSGDQTDLSPAYESVDLQERIWNVSNAISLTIKSLENIIEEINARGGE